MPQLIFCLYDIILKVCYNAQKENTKKHEEGHNPGDILSNANTYLMSNSPYHKEAQSDDRKEERIYQLQEYGQFSK